MNSNSRYAKVVIRPADGTRLTPPGGSDTCAPMAKADFSESAEARFVPSFFKFCSGGFCSYSTCIKLINRQLRYDQNDDFIVEDLPEDAPSVVPTEEQWAVFAKALDDIGFWQWKRSYHSPICDGHQWGLSIQLGTRAKNVYGSNAYPEPEKLFHQLEAAVEQLTGLVISLERVHRQGGFGQRGLRGLRGTYPSN